MPRSIPGGNRIRNPPGKKSAPEMETAGISPKVKPFQERKEKMEEKIRQKLEELRIHLQADGGDLEVIAVNGKTVQVKLQGACGCCPHATMTIKEGLQRILREEIDPEIVVERV